MTSTPRVALVVDDNVINQKVVSKMLLNLEVTSEFAGNGLEAVHAVQQRRYDIIFMDVQMPEMDGLEATNTIRKNEGNEHHSIIIALTANAMKGDRERCIESGMDDYLAKPVLQVDIERMIAKWIPKQTPGGMQDGDFSTSDPKEIIDSKRIKQIIEIGENDLLIELFSLFLEDLDLIARDIQRAIANQHYQQIFECAHKLKGSAANLGANSLTQVCISLEQLAKDKDRSRIDEQFSVMQREIAKVRAHITATYF